MIRSIEGLRGVAALLVVLFHSYGNHWGSWVGEMGLIKYAFLCVDLFFVISGFVMASVYGETLRTGPQVQAYMVRRFYRLYPLHIVMVFLVLLMHVAIQSAKYLLAAKGISLGSEAPFSVPVFDPLYFFLEVVLLNGVGLYFLEIGNYPNWSISVEFWMYVMFALLYWQVQAQRARQVLSAVIALGAAGWMAWRWSALPEVPSMWEGNLARGLMSFFAGVLLSDVWRWWKPRLAARAAGATGGLASVTVLQLLATALALAAIGFQPLLGWGQLAVPLVFGLLVLTLLPDTGPVARLLQSRPAQWLGEHSYSMYLTHIFVLIPLDVFGRKFDGPMKHAVGAVYLVAVLVVSVLSYRYLETPWRARGKAVAQRLEGREEGHGKPR